VAVVEVVFGIAAVKQARVDRVVVQDHQAETAVEQPFKAATVLLDRDFQVAQDVDLIVKAIINTPVVGVGVQVAQAKIQVITDMNILHQTVVLAWHQTCWETHITLQAAAVADHTICLQVEARAESVAEVVEHVITELH
jgi:hypothetical protein